MPADARPRQAQPAGLILQDRDAVWVTDFAPRDPVPYKLIIFDFDGTLADSGTWFVEALRDAAVRYRFRKVETAELEMLRGWETRAIIRHLRVPTWKLPLIARHMRARVAADIGAISLFEGTPTLLRSLAATGFVLAIVSSNAEANIRLILGPELAALIGYFECGASLFGKAAGIRRVAKRARIHPAAILAVGDEVRDVDAARAAGVASGAATWGYASAALLRSRQPTLIFASMDEVVARLAGSG